MAEMAIKKVILSQIAEDLVNGLTKWKKDDIGFGSLEKKYGLQLNEMIELLAHPKIKSLETRIPTFMIVDDLPEPEIKIEVNTTIEVGPSQPVMQEEKQTVVYVKETVKSNTKLEAFI